MGYAAEEGRLVYVGNLPHDARENEVHDLFRKYGRIRDADDAVHGRDGYDYYGYRLRVELAKGNRRDRDRDRGDRSDRGDRGGRSRSFRAPNTGYRVLVEGLPSSASWQDLKDFIRQVVRPAYTDVSKESDDGAVGVVEFDSAEDMDRCIRKLDDTEFKNPFDKNCFVRIREDKQSRGRDRSRSRSPRRGRSPGGGGRGRERSTSPAQRRSSRSPPRDIERSRSRSPVRGNERSPSPR